MYYKNKNISFSQKILNPVIKYKKAEREDDKFITKSGLITDQKVYRNREKSSLLAYIQKEGNVFKSRKKIKENEGIKHLIISPIDPVLYNKLDNKEKKELQQIIVKNLFKDFAGYGFIGGIENKERSINGKKYDHFHIHIGISEKYDISPQNIDYLKRSITKTILNSKFKEKLGLKTKSELIKETFSKKYEKLYQEKLENYENIKFLFAEMLDINNKLKEEKNDITNIKYDISELNKERKKELTYINKEKEFLIEDIKQTSNILKSKNLSLKEINKEFTKTFEIFRTEKDNLYKTLKKELEGLKNILNDDLKYFKNVLKFEHNIYVKFLKHKLKNKEIDLPTFLYLISVNKYYMKNRIKYKQEKIKLQIKNKEKEIKGKLQELQYKLENKLQYLQNEKKYIEFSKKFDEKNLENLMKKLKVLEKSKKNILEKYFSKINLLYEYMKLKQKKYKQLLLQKQQKQEKIKNNQETIKNIKKEQKEIKKYMYNEEILKIMIKYNLSPEEIKKEYEKFLKDKKIFSNINFENYLRAYAIQKLLEKERYTAIEEQDIYLE